jgi:hypothetical protein
MGIASVKRMVVLANSVKRSHWCVAGKELFGGEGNWTPGLWVRPVDPAHEGAITAEAMRLEENRVPRFLDIVDVPILQHAQDANHPEDWIADTSRRWVRQGIFPLADLPRLLDRPAYLWKGFRDSRIVRGGYVSKMMRPASLYFIKPEGEAKAAVYWDEEKKRVRKRLHLSYNGQDHEFDITDPLFEGSYVGSRHIKTRELLDIPLAADGRLHLCLSLTPEFNGAHYKIAATIWEAPPA